MQSLNLSKSFMNLKIQMCKDGICLAARRLVDAPAGCRGRNFAIFCAYYRLNVKFFNKSYLICKIVNFVKFTIELCHHLLIVFSTVWILYHGMEILR